MQPYKVTYQVNNHDWGTINRRSGGVDYDWTGNSYYTDARGYLSNSVSAKANEGFEFSHWEVNGEKINLPYNFTAGELAYTENSELKAFFKPAGSWKLTYTVESGGSVNLTEDYATTASYPAAGVTATPDAYSVFMGWYIGNELFSTKYSLTAEDLSAAYFDGDTTLTAKFIPPVTITYAKVSLNSGNGTLERTSEIVKPFAQAMGCNVTPYAVNGVDSYFVYWADKDGNVVSTSSKFIPTGDQLINSATYYAYFSRGDAYVITVSDHAIAKVDTSSSFTNDNTGSRLGLSGRAYVYDANGNRWNSANSDIELVEWSVTDRNGEVISISANTYDTYRDDSGPNLHPAIVVAVVKPKHTFIVNYQVQTGDIVGNVTGGTINNFTDYAGSDTAVGVTATENIVSGYHFLGWYIGERRASTNETITAQDLSEWKNAGYIKEDFTTITARFGMGNLVTYKENVDGKEKELSAERITIGLPHGYTAEEKEGYNFLGWYRGEELISEDRVLSYIEIGPISEDVIFTAKYGKANTATYTVDNVGGIVENEEVISRYGEIALGSVRTHDSTIQTAAVGGVLAKSATAVAMPGCKFIGWTVTDKDGNTVTIAGFDSSLATIPSNIVISEDVIFTAHFEKLNTSLELVYNIQEDQDRHAYGASLTVDGRTVYGTATQSAYISEIVPQGGAAKGCSSQGIVINGDQYDITGWVLGKNNEPNKDKLFTLYSTFVPNGEYLQDVNGTGVRYFRVVPKWEQNVYVQTKVSDPAGGDFYLGSNEVYTEKLIFINNRTRTEADLENKLGGGLADNFRTEMSRYTVKVNDGYKLVSFSFNGKELELKTPITDNENHSLNASELELKEPITLVSKIEKDENGEFKTVTVTTLLDYGYHTAIFRNVDGDVERSLNILVANFEKLNSFNVQYHVLSGSGEVSNTSDSFNETDKDTWLANKDSVYPIAGSTAIADVDNDYVFDHWEWDDETGEKEEGTDIVIRKTSLDAYLLPDITKMTNPDMTYHYYAVFAQKPKVNIVYIPDNPEHGMTMPGNESVYQGDNAAGSIATAFDGWNFLYWTREGSDGIISTDPNFVPQVYNGTSRDGDHVFSTDFTNPVSTVTFVAHFAQKDTGSITVHKTVERKNGLSMDSLDGMTIYFALTKDGKQQDYLTKDSEVWTEKITLTKDNIGTDGVVSATATFSNLPDGNYEVWELAIISNSLVKQYVGMVVAEGVQIEKISASNDSNSGGNNAILSGEDNQRNVYFTNTYSMPTDTTVFEVSKEWQDSEGTVLTDSSIPKEAQVEITVYQEIDGVTKAFRSIILDGTPDVDGEDSPWNAKFENLPTKNSEGSDIIYKVRETGEWPGFEPYINSGKTYLYENLYMTNSGGKIINRALEENKVLVTVLKVDKENSKPLAGASFILTKDNGSGAYVNFGKDQYSVSEEELDKGTFTVALQDGFYKLQEKTAPNGYVIVTSAFDFEIEDGTLKGRDDDYISFDAENMMIIIKNEPGVALPSTGGPGTKVFYLLGAFLVMSATMLTIQKRRKW